MGFITWDRNRETPAQTDAQMSTLEVGGGRTRRQCGRGEASYVSPFSFLQSSLRKQEADNRVPRLNRSEL